MPDVLLHLVATGPQILVDGVGVGIVREIQQFVVGAGVVLIGFVLLDEVFGEPAQLVLSRPSTDVLTVVVAVLVLVCRKRLVIVGFVVFKVREELLLPDILRESVAELRPR
jgi:hypothetical protein